MQLSRAAQDVTPWSIAAVVVVTVEEHLTGLLRAGARNGGYQQWSWFVRLHKSLLLDSSRVAAAKYLTAAKPTDAS
jgi:hypothetical protein